MRLFTKVVGTECLGQVDPQCQHFVAKSRLPAYKRFCDCGSKVIERTVPNFPVIVALFGTAAIVLGVGGYIVYSRNIRAVDHAADPMRFTIRDIEGLLQRGDYAKVVMIGDTALKTAPDDATLLNNVGSALIKLGDSNRAKIYLAHAVALKPNDPYLRYNQACAEARSGEKEEAINHLKKACQLGLAPATFRQDPDLSSLAGSLEFEQMVTSKTCQ